MNRQWHSATARPNPRRRSYLVRNQSFARQSISSFHRSGVYFHRRVAPTALLSSPSCWSHALVKFTGNVWERRASPFRFSRGGGLPLNRRVMPLVFNPSGYDLLWRPQFAQLYAVDTGKHAADCTKTRPFDTRNPNLFWGRAQFSCLQFCNLTTGLACADDTESTAVAVLLQQLLSADADAACWSSCHLLVGKITTL